MLIIPVFDAEKDQSSFVSTDKIKPRLIQLGDVSFHTAPLAFGKSVNLLSISEHPDLLAAGLQDRTDYLDVTAWLSRLYFEVKEGDQWVVVSMTPYSGQFPFALTPNRHLNLAAMDPVLSCISDDLLTMAKIHVAFAGMIQMEFGTIKVDSNVIVDSENIRPLGYELNIARCNPHRRPH